MRAGVIERGLVKAANFRNSRNKRVYLYKLTPRGLSERAALALRFLRRKEQEPQTLLQKIEVLRAEIDQGKSGEHSCVAGLPHTASRVRVGEREMPEPPVL